MNNLQDTSSQTASVNYAFQKGLEVYLSDYTRVTNFSEINGMTFKEFDCAGTSASKTFNAEGSITSNGMQGTSVLLTSAFLTVGGTLEEGSTKTGYVYKIPTSSGLKYFLVTIVDSSLGRYYTFSYQP